MNKFVNWLYFNTLILDASFEPLSNIHTYQINERRSRRQQNLRTQ
jgi:hypothetical protein